MFLSFLYLRNFSVIAKRDWVRNEQKNIHFGSYRSEENMVILLAIVTLLYVSYGI